MTADEKFGTLKTSGEAYRGAEPDGNNYSHDAESSLGASYSVCLRDWDGQRSDATLPKGFLFGEYDMAVSHTTYVWSINNILPERKFALLVLADYAGQTFTEERAIVLINKYTGYSLEQSSEMIAALIQEGIHIQRWGDEFRIPAPDTMLPSLAKKPKSKSITRRFAKAVAERDGGWLCHYCGAKLLPPDDPALHGNFAICDHKLARHSGGTDALGNLVLACRRCNDRKGTKPYEQFLREIGR